MSAYVKWYNSQSDDVKRVVDKNRDVCEMMFYALLSSKHG